MIRDLDAEQFGVREKASTKLEQMGEEVEPALSRVLEGKVSLETRRRIERLLQKFDKDPPAQERVRRLRTLEILELTATPEARQLLDTLAKEAPGAWYRQEAKQAAARLGKRLRP